MQRHGHLGHHLVPDEDEIHIIAGLDITKASHGHPPVGQVRDVADIKACPVGEPEFNGGDVAGARRALLLDTVWENSPVELWSEHGLGRFLQVATYLVKLLTADVAARVALSGDV